MLCEVTLLVNDLDACRYFYREILALGEPETDSNLGCAFRLSPETVLVLEKSAAPYLEHASAACCWSLLHPAYDQAEANLAKNEMPLGPEFIRNGRKWRRGCDPEGNPFFLSRP